MGLIYIKYIINIKKANGSKGVYIKKLKNTRNNLRFPLNTAYLNKRGVPAKQLLHPPPPPCYRLNLVHIPLPEQSFMVLIYIKLGNRALSSVNIVSPTVYPPFVVNYDFNYFPL